MDSDLTEIVKKKPIVLLNDAYWEPNVKEWVPKLMIEELDKEQKETIVQKLFVIVLAPSNMSRCDSCGRTINKGTYRIGVPVYDRRGMYGIINRWNHIGSCSQKYLKKGIKGYEDNINTVEKRISSILFGWEYLPIGVREDIIDLSIKEDIVSNSECSVLNSENLIDRSIVEVRETPINLIYDLLQFQKEGLAWMCNQEKSIAKGGILADEMGMGKTIQTISLLLEHDIPPLIEDNNNGKDIIGKNLVIAPVAAVLQWKQEIEKFTKPGSLKVHIYHGSNRNRNKNKNTKHEYGGVDINEADVVITTYPTLEAEYRKISSTFKSKCPYCDRSYLKRTLKIHLRYFCGPNAKRTAKQALTERKRDGLKKAMRTLKIGLEEGVDKAKQLEDIARSLPTISNVYREILAKADLLDEDTLASSMPWFSKRNSIRKRENENNKELNRNDVNKKVNKEEVNEEEINKDEINKEEINKDVNRWNNTRKKIRRINSEGEYSEVVNKKENIHLLLEWGGIKLPLKSETVKSIKSFLSSIQHSKNHLINRFNIEEKMLDNLIDLNNHSKNLRKLELVEKLSNILELNSNDKEKSNSKKSSRNRIRNNKEKKNRKDEDYDDEDFEDEYNDDQDYDDEDYEENEYETNKDEEYENNEDENEIENDDSIDEQDDEQEIVLKLRNCSGIFERNWNRIILDEAHRIKARTTSTAKAIFALKCRGTKWCLTGTPLQNRVGELYSLVRFVGFHPYAYYFCQKNGCNCRQLNYVNHMKYCTTCNHARSCHFSYFNKMIINPIKRYGFSGEGSEALRRLKEEVLDKVLLRRTKVQRQEDVKLPPLRIKVIYNELSPAEKDFYTSLYQRSKVQFDTFVNQGTILHNYAHVFDLISRLRQAVDHPYLIVYGKFNNKKYEDNLEGIDKNDNDLDEPDKELDYNLTLNDEVKVIPSKSRASNNEDLCYLCMDNVTVDQRVTSKCKHGFHIKCIKEYIDQAPQVDEYITDHSIDEGTLMRGVLGCPVCYVPLTIDFNTNNKEFHSVSTNDEENDANDDIELEKQEEQIERDLERLEMAKKLGINIENNSDNIYNEDNKVDNLSFVKNKNIIRQIKTQGFESSTKIDSLLEEVNKMILENPDAKGIVFSQFTNMLDLVSYRLKKANIGCVMLAGSMSILQRNSILYSFNKFPDLKLILISLKAGGEGLNLQVANYVFLLDPWWNPAVELQAFQRAHRIGQKKEVTALRFITKDTIEERMFQLQEKKQLVFDGTVGASNNALNKLNSDDLKFLFQN